MNSSNKCIHKPKWKWWNLFYPVLFNYEEENFVCKKCGERIQRELPLTCHERFLHSFGIFFISTIFTVLINLPFATNFIISRNMFIVILVETLLISQPFIRMFARLFKLKFAKYVSIESQNGFKDAEICGANRKKMKHIPKISIKDFFSICFGARQQMFFECKNCKKIIVLKYASVEEYNRKTSVFWIHFLIMYSMITKVIYSYLSSMNVLIAILNISIFILAQIVLVYFYETRAFEFVALNE